MRTLLSHYALILSVAGVVLFTSLGKARLWDRDEPRNAGCAEEMMARGDLITPVFNDELRTAKPVLLYWLIMTAYSIFGVNEFAARFWSAVLAIGTVLATYHIGRRLFNAHVGLWSALILSTSLMFDVAGRAATPDAPLIFLSTTALLVFVLGTFKPRSEMAAPVAPQLRHEHMWFPASWGVVVLLYAIMGLALLAKGPVGLVVPTAIIGMFLLIVRLEPNSIPASPPVGRDAAPAGNTKRCRILTAVCVVVTFALLEQCAGLKAALGAAGLVALFLCVTGRRSQLRFLRPFAPRHFFRTCWHMRPLTALAVALAVAAPWYVWVGIRTNGEFLREFFFTEHFGRATTAMENHSGPFFFYPFAILVGFLPWSILIAPMLIDTVRRIRRSDPWSSGYVFAACWIGVYVGVFSLATTKLPSYVTPCYPALALLGGCFTYHWTRGAALAADQWPRAAMACLASVGLLIAIGVPIAATILLPGKQWLGVIGTIPIAGAAVCWFQFYRNQRRLVAATLVVTATGFTTAVFGVATVEVDELQQSHVLLSAIKQESDAPKIGTLGVLEPSWVFYAKQPIWELTGYRQGEEPPATAPARERNWHPKPRLDIKSFFDDDGDVFVITTREHYAQLKSHLPPDAKILADTQYFMRKPNKRLIVVGCTRHEVRTATSSKSPEAHR